MTKLRERMLQDMQLRGFSETTQECYLRSVRLLAQHYTKPPTLITEEELRDYFLYVKNVKKWKRATVTISVCGTKFFFTQTLKRQWATFDLVRPQHEKRLPVILTREEFQRILRCVRFQCYQVCLLTERIKELFGLFKSEDQKTTSGRCLTAEVRVMRCPACGSEMLFIKEIKPDSWRAPPWPAA